MTDDKLGNIAGMSLRGGRKDNFYFCLLEYFPEGKRWFLKSVLQVKDEPILGGDDAIRSWIERYELKKLVVDFPLSQPLCLDCVLDCPGSLKCPLPEVVGVRHRMESLLDEDKKNEESDPKAYERRRNSDDQVLYSKDVFGKSSTNPLLSRSFKRRLKKGFLPYWNRPLDLWIWSYFYDQLLDLFNISYDSFGSVSLMTQNRFLYLRRHFPTSLELFEGHCQITLIELLRAKYINKRDVVELNDFEGGVEARLDIIKKIEHSLNIFIYDHDLELIVKNPRAFDSFILALTGKSLDLKRVHDIEEWASPTRSRFIAPKFDMKG